MLTMNIYEFTRKIKSQIHDILAENSHYNADGLHLAI